MSQNLDQLITYCDKPSQLTSALFGDGEEAGVLPRLGNTNILIYTGSEQEEFIGFVQSYKAPPVSSAMRYSPCDFGEDSVVFFAGHPDRLYAAMDQPISSTTLPPETTTPEPPQQVDGADDPHFTGDEANNDAPARTWNPNNFFKGN